MRSQAQIEASRRNGAKSKGPTTAKGKAIAARNSTTHGLYADKAVVLEGEDPEAWNALLAQTIRDFSPINGTELDLVTEIAVARWRVRRCWTIETATADMEIAQQRGQLEKQFQNPDMPMRHASAYIGAEHGMRLIDRYEIRLTRIYYRAIKNLNDFRARGTFNNNTSAGADAPALFLTPRLSNLLAEPAWQPETTKFRIEPKNPCIINTGREVEPENPKAA